MTDTAKELLADKRNKAERLLNAVVDHIAGTLEQPSDERAWSQLLIYCPKELIEERMKAIRELGAASVEAALAYADGYKEALDDCERANVGELIEQVAGLEGKLSFERALRSDAERKYRYQAANLAELEDKLRLSARQQASVESLAELIAKHWYWDMHSIMHDHDENWRKFEKRELYLSVARYVLRALLAKYDIFEKVEG